jgi:signal transduction histidine kinase
MPDEQLRILLIEESYDYATMLQQMLLGQIGEESSVHWVDSLARGLESLEEEPFDVILLDLGLSGSRGLGNLAKVQARSPQLPIVVLTSLDDERLATEAIQRGAQDYFVKEESGANLLVRAIRYAIERKTTEDSLRQNQALLQATERIAKVGGWELDLVTMELLWTDEVYRIHEVDKDYQPTLDSAMTFYSPEARPILTAAIERAIEEGEPFELQLPLIITGGSPCWVQIIGQPQVQDGKTVKLSGTFQDVTDRKMMERALRDSEQALLRLSENLEQRVAKRTEALEQEIAERRRMETWLLSQRARLRTLTARLAQVEEDERKRLAGILHDQVGQNLTALSINLRILRTQLASMPDNPTMLEQFASRLGDTLDLVKQTSQRIRYVMEDLRPPALEEYGLLAALRWYGERFSAQTNLDISVQGPEQMPRLSSSQESTLFRIAQEALTNVVRHAKATRAQIKIEMEETRIRLLVRDNGVGFDPDSSPASRERPCWGIQLMVERAEAIDGSCRIESTPGAGTAVIVEAAR